MIDFQLTPADEKILSSAHEQAQIGRRYASYYDKHEDELESAEFPEAAGLPNPITLAEEGVSEAADRGSFIRWSCWKSIGAGFPCIAANGDSATRCSRRSQLLSKSRNGRSTR